MGWISFLRSILFAAQSMRLFRAVAIFMLSSHSTQPIRFTRMSHLWRTILLIDPGRIQFWGDLSVDSDIRVGPISLAEYV